MAKNSGKKIVELPGMEGDGVAPVSIPEIDKACAVYIRERDKRCEMTPKEVKAKDALIDIIQKHVDAGTIKKDASGKVVYLYDDEKITIKPGKVKLTVEKMSGPDEED